MCATPNAGETPTSLEALLLQLKSQLYALQSSGDSQAGLWLETFRERSSWKEATALWNCVVSERDEMTVEATSVTIDMPLRFFLAQMLAAKVSCEGDSALHWILSTSEVELAKRQPSSSGCGDAAARHLAGAAAAALLRHASTSLLDAILKRWLATTMSVATTFSDHIVAAGADAAEHFVLTAATTTQLLGFLAEEAQRLATMTAPRSRIAKGRATIVLDFSVSPPGNNVETAWLGCLTPDATRLLSGAFARVLQALACAAMSAGEASKSAASTKRSTDQVRSLGEAALRSFEAWVSIGALLIEAQPKLAINAASVACAEFMRVSPVLGDCFLVLLAKACPGDALAAQALTAAAEFATAVTSASVSGAMEGDMDMVRSTLHMVGEGALAWWHILRGESSGSYESGQAVGWHTDPVRWCVLVNAIGPSLLIHPGPGHALLSALSEIIVDLARWPCHVRQAALEPWSSVLADAGVAASPADPRHLHSSPLAASANALLVDLQRRLTPTVVCGLRMGSEAPEALASLRDHAMAVLVEWRIATREDFLLETALEMLSCGRRDVRTKELGLFLLGVCVPRVCRLGPTSALEVVLEELHYSLCTLQMSAPDARCAAGLRATLAVFLRKASPALSRGNFEDGRVSPQKQARALEGVLSALTNECFWAPAGQAGTVGEEALRLAVAAFVAVVREGAWLEPVGVLAGVRLQLENTVWPTDAGGTLVRAYCSVLNDLSDSDALIGLELLCQPLLARLRTCAPDNVPLRELRLLLTSLRVAPMGLCWQGEPCALVLLGEIWRVLEALPQDVLNSSELAVVFTDDLLGVVLTHSETLAVRSIWMPKLVEALSVLGPKPVVLRALSALFEVYRCDATPDPLPVLLRDLLTMAASNLQQHLTEHQREELLSACFDLLASSGSCLSDWNVDEGGGKLPLQWAHAGLAALPQVRSPELARSIMAHCASLLCSGLLSPGLLLKATLSMLTAGPIAFRTDPTLVASLARPAYTAARIVAELDHEDALDHSLPSICVPAIVGERFDRLCVGAGAGNIPFTDFVHGFEDLLRLTV